MKHHKLSSRLSTAAAVVLSLCASVDAYAIDYTVNLTAPGGGTLTGTISTNGTLGALATGDFTGFSLTWNYPNVQMLVNSSNGMLNVFEFGTGQQLRATASSLYMLNNPNSDSTTLAIEETNQSFLSFFVSGEGLAFGANGVQVFPPLARIQAPNLLGGSGFETADFTNSGAQFTIGTVAAVPEPSAYALMGLGLLGVSAAVRRQRKAA
jgi:PEP-CTERM motif